MDNLNFYELLDSIKTATGRKELISTLLKNSDLVSLFGNEAKNAKLLEDRALPSDEDNPLSLPFAVGFRYELDEPYEYPRKYYAYILGIVRLPSDEKKLLTACSLDSTFCCIQRSFFSDPLFTDS